MSLVLENIPFLLKGAYYTLLITVVSMFFGLIIGVVVAIARIKGNRPIQWLARAYVSIIRGTPALVQIFIVYYGLVDYGIALSSLTRLLLHSVSMSVLTCPKPSGEPFFPFRKGRQRQTMQPE